MAANPIHTNSVTVDENGVLSEWVAQPNFGPQENNGEMTYLEVWKGPYSNGKGILSNIAVGDSLSAVHSALGSKNELFNTPSCPTRNGKTGYWKVGNIDCKQIESGSHCTLNITYSATYSGEDGNLEDDPYQDVWSISWQSYTVSPYAFCKNPEVALNNHVGSPDDNYAYFAKRSTIEKYLSQSGKDNVFDNEGGVGMQKYKLNDAEKLILKKVNSNTQAVYHYPVIVHQTVKKGEFLENAEYDQDLGEDLDVLTDLPDDCPYSFSSPTGYDEWQWIKIGDDISQTKTKTVVSFTRKETWMGVVDGDENYYGDELFQHTSALLTCRWKLGEV